MIDFSQTVTTLNGKEVMIEQGVIATLGQIIARALDIKVTQEMSVIDAYKRGKLALDLNEGKQVELTQDQIKMIGEAVLKVYDNTLAVKVCNLIGFVPNEAK